MFCDAFHHPLRKSLFTVLSAVVIFSSCQEKKPEFQSEHFTIEEISNGVYAAIHKAGGEAICNAGIIDLGEETLVFDCFLTPKAAEDLKKAAEMLTGRPVTYVVNSHYHNDHIRGNQVFDKETIIISTRKTKELIRQHEPKEIQSEKEYGPGWLAELEQEFDTTTNSVRKQELIMWIAYVKGMLNSHDILKTVLPDSLFSGQLEINGTKRNVKLVEYVNGHTENDIILYLNSENILFAGDLLFVGCHPYLANGDPLNLIEILNELKQLNSKRIIPGHGELGNNDDIDHLIHYINEVEGLSKEYISENKTIKDIRDEDIPEEFKDWTLQNFFKYNLGYMLTRNDSIDDIEN